MRNIETRTTTIKAIMSSKPFLDGFCDVMRDRGWNEPKDDKEQWRYERGRLFASWLKSQGVPLAQYPLKQGRWVTNTTVQHYKAARQQKAVI
jgi:hypothetical protein